jgi:hypothetical protein
MTAKSERKLRTQAGKKPVKRNCLRVMLMKKAPKKRSTDMRKTSVPCSQPGPRRTPSALRQSTWLRSSGSANDGTLQLMRLLLLKGTVSPDTGFISVSLN